MTKAKPVKTNKSAKWFNKLYVSTAWRERYLIKQFDKFMPSSGKVLDIGSGSGTLAWQVQTNFNLEVAIIDVVDHNLSPLPSQLYDGKSLPFKDNSFDVCLIVFVLHHAPNYEQVITEALRVSRSKVIVVEDDPRNALERLAWRSWDYSLNHAFHKDVDVAHGTHNVSQWKKVFKKCGAKVVYTKSFRAVFPVLATYPHSVFVLEK